MTKYFKSGLYEGEAFYTKHELDFNADYFSYDDIDCDFELLADYYEKHYDFVYEDEEGRRQQTHDEFWEKLSLYTIYFEPIVFNQEIALECGLTPFTYQEKGMLALSGYGMDLSPRLEAYQALTHCTIDERSRFLSKHGCSWFEQIMGHDITQKILMTVDYSEVQNILTTTIKT